jgi:hypothetical protein
VVSSRVLPVRRAITAHFARSNNARANTSSHGRHHRVVPLAVRCQPSTISACNGGFEVISGLASEAVRMALMTPSIHGTARSSLHSARFISPPPKTATSAEYNLICKYWNVFCPTGPQREIRYRLC